MATTKRATHRKSTAGKAVTAAAKEGKELLTSENVRFLIGVIILIAALYISLALVSFYFTGADDQALMESGDLTRGISNWAGALGASLSYYFVNECFGMASAFIPVFFVALSLKLMKIGKIRLWKWFINIAFLIIWFSVALQYFIPDHIINSLFFIPGGKHGQFVCDTLVSNLGQPGAFLVLLVALLVYFVYLSDETVRMIKAGFSKVGKLKIKVGKKDTPAETGESDVVLQETQAEGDVPAGEETAEHDDPGDSAGDNDSDGAVTGNDGEDNPSSEGEGAEEGLYDPRKDLENYKFPTLSLLKHYADTGVTVDDAEKRLNEERIRNTLRNFDVEISEIKATIGPTVTLYEITPARGVRIAKIKNLEDDIALSLSATGIRIIAPIPGKGTIGIEVPNKTPQIVSMESILNTDEFRNFKGELPVALGKTITNEPFMFDLAKLPHLLVAGATGQGKSVGLNAIITSLLYRKHPAELKLVLIDPKKVEFSIYSSLENHFLAKVPDENEDAIITDTDRVIYTLNSLCKEMDTRYTLLKRARVRNIKEYNKRFCERKLNPEKGHRYLPYIVVVVDEFGDLIMTAGKAIETPISRIAQLARAVGMHMIIATQRPTTNIITGTIKANFPARIAFKVAASVDSRTILDRTGANRLIGRGDMLYLAGGEPVRVQCAFVDTPEVENITSYIAKQQGYTSAFMLPEVPMPETSGSGGSNGGGDDIIRLDPLFEEVAKEVVESGQGSTSSIQRRHNIGYNRAGRIMDQLEKAGIVGPQVGSKPREVLCSSQMDLDQKIADLL